MGGGDHHLGGGKAGDLAGGILGAIHKIPRDHAGVHNGHDETGRAVVQGQSADIETVGVGAGGALGEHGVDQHGEVGGRNIDAMGARAEDFIGGGDRTGAGQGEQRRRQRGPNEGTTQDWGE